MTIEERALLASVLYDRTAYPTVSHLRPVDFEGAGHALIWEAVQRVATEGGTIEPPSISASLAARGELERAGGSGAIVDLTTTDFVPGNAATYAQMVADRAARRRLGDAGRWLAHEATYSEAPALLAARTIEGLTSILEGMASRQAGPARSYQQLLDLEFDEKWISPEIFAAGDRLVLTGREGLGKSTLMRQIGVSVAAGLSPFTHDPVPAKRVLVVDCENGDSLNQAKYRPIITRAQIASGNKIPHDHLMIESRVDGLDLTGQRDIAWLLSMVEANHPDLVIIGPIYKLHNGSPNDEEPARRVMATLDRVRATGAALAIEAHAPHGEEMVRPIGASIWLRWPEFGYGLRAAGKGENLVDLVSWRGPRDQRSFPAQLRRGGTWPWSDPKAPMARWDLPADLPPEDRADRSWPQLPPAGSR